MVQLPIKLSRGVPATLQSQIYDQIRSLILSGHLRPGQRMPSSRAFAAEHGIARNTAMIAYDRLVAEGYLRAKPATLTCVGAELPEQSILQNRLLAAAPAASGRRVNAQPVVFTGRGQDFSPAGRPSVEIDFFVGRPSADSFPRELWRRLLVRKLVEAGSALTEYGDPAGWKALRAAVASHLGATRGISTEPDQIVITSGIQEALNIVARLFVREGTAVATENPCYLGLFNVFQSYGARMIPVAVDAEGIMPSRLPRRPVSLLCVTPSHQFPIGYTLSLERRLRLLDWAANSGAYIVEDDYDSDFRYDGPPLTALAGLDSRRLVIYLGTFSKSIGAGVRVGYLVLPPDLVRPAIAVKSILNNGRGWLDQAVLAEFIEDSHFIKHLRHIRVAYKSRRDVLVAALRRRFGEVVLSGRRGGMHVAWHLSPDFPTAAEVERCARRRGVGIYTLPSAASYDYGGCPYSERCLIIGYPALSEQEIAEGVARLDSALFGQARRTLASRSADGRTQPGLAAAN